MSYYVTTPIYYVNAEPHLGHAYSTMAADILARHMRQRGEDVFFLTGTDEHGEPIETAAEREGDHAAGAGRPQRAKFAALMPIIDATNDFFIRTSDPRTTAQGRRDHAARLRQRLGHQGTYEGWYCPRCADFKTERELGPGQHLPDPRDPARAGARGELVLPPLRLPGAARAASTRSGPTSSSPTSAATRRSPSSSSGLEDVSLSRPTLNWGVPLPWDPEQRMYVWFDALLNYVTALTFAREGEDLTERFWPADLHVMAKDILKFHAVIWPALLLAAEPRAAASGCRSTATC